MQKDVYETGCNRYFMKNAMYMKQLVLIVVVATMLTLPASSSFASEVPFEVVKTKVKATITVPLETEVVVVNGRAYDTGSFSPDGATPGLPDKSPMEYYDGLDPRPRVPIEGIHYEMEFWNVGAMGGEKGFIFKSSYDKATIKISYLTGQAYKNVRVGESFGGFQMQEKREVSTPSIDDIELDLIFSGGPYGAFTYVKPIKEGSVVKQVGSLSDGYAIELNDFGIEEHLVYEDGVRLTVDGDGFVKWMEILEAHPGCQDPSDSTTDSGHRFNDHNGYVSVFPCDDEEAEMSAQLDMVLHKNDLIVTHEDSFADVAISDSMTNAHIGPNSKVILSYEKDNPGLVRSLKLITGKVKRNVENMLDGKDFEDDMWQAAAGIKGTTYILEEIGEGSTVKVIEGLVEFKSKSTGEIEMVGPGEAVTATQDGLEEKSAFDVEAENQIWEDAKNGTFDEDYFPERSNVDSESRGESQSYTVWYVTFLLVITSVGYFVKRKRTVKSEKDDSDTTNGIEMN